MNTRTLTALIAVLAVALTAGACRRDEIPEDQYPGNDVNQETDLTVEPMHNYADDAEEDISEENAEEELDRLSEEVERDVEGMEQ
jgi:hypothetical protein